MVVRYQDLIGQRDPHGRSKKFPKVKEQRQAASEETAEAIQPMQKKIEKSKARTEAKKAERAAARAAKKSSGKEEADPLPRDTDYDK